MIQDGVADLEIKVFVLMDGLDHCVLEKVMQLLEEFEIS